MEPLTVLLLYFAANLGVTASAIFYWMAIENVQPIEIRQKEHKGLIPVFVLSLLFTPFGAYLISLVIKVRKVLPMLKTSDN